MPWIVTPGYLRCVAEFYHQAHSLTAAGVSILQALDQLRRSPPAGWLRAPLRRIITQIEQGGTFAESVANLGQTFPPFDIALLRAGELSGRLEGCFRLLAEYYRDRAQLARAVLSDLAYPVFIFHFAVLIFPPAMLARIFYAGGITELLLQKLGILLPIYGVVLLLVYACQSRHGETWRTVIETLLGAVPLLGRARRELALARLAAALEALISAGVPIIEAWLLAAAASGSPALHRAVRSWHADLEAGQTPSEALARTSVFPEVFTSLYRTAEVSGDLDNTLRRINSYYLDEGTRRLKAASQWGPRLIYIVILFAVGYKIIQFWQGYFEQQQNLLEGF